MKTKIRIAILLDLRLDEEPCTLERPEADLVLIAGNTSAADPVGVSTWPARQFSGTPSALVAGGGDFKSFSRAETLSYMRHGAAGTAVKVLDNEVFELAFPTGRPRVLGAPL